MTTLYRSPTIIIDKHEWHAIVLLIGKRVSLHYKFRALSPNAAEWSNITAWPGRKPKGFAHRFGIFKHHINRAMMSETVRREAIAGLKVAA